MRLNVRQHPLLPYHLQLTSVKLIMSVIDRTGGTRKYIHTLNKCRAQHCVFVCENCAKRQGLHCVRAYLCRESRCVLVKIRSQCETFVQKSFYWLAIACPVKRSAAISSLNLPLQRLVTAYRALQIAKPSFWGRVPSTACERIRTQTNRASYRAKAQRGQHFLRRLAHSTACQCMPAHTSGRTT